ncbi:M23 family metallopeptidase [Thalassobius vesicularis]|uniref:M23 family metallopeptidase n=1 Tax=Thalassobius vesicularis TaxID=1294297 RepID=A0A4S3M5S3_9RHOB|nr:M23 family metallopeptidase [Thalassobius vesicularis]
MRFAALTALCSLAMPAMAGEFSLRQPIDCRLGETCFVQQYVDHDPGPGALDFTCGPQSYDGHKGTDFGLPSFAAMRAGVNVLASAPGVVMGLRDGEPDTGIGPGTQDKECGNGVVLDHGDGWQTQYCHMKRGSVTVRKGQKVEAGAMLGQVGFSGQTQFPHVHLSVRRNGQVVDPFDPDGKITCGTPETRTLWQTPLPVSPGGMISAGFAPQVPGFDAVKDGSAGDEQMSAQAPALVVWGYAFGSRPGDSLRIEIIGPDGPFLQTVTPLDKAQAQFFRAAGKKRPTQGFTQGRYQGYIALIRNGKIVDDITAHVTLR